MVKTLNASAFTCSLKGLLSSICASVLLIPLTAWALSASDDPRVMISVLPKLIAVLSALLGGIVCARCGGSRPLLSALICGASLFVLNVSVALIMGGSLLSLPLGLLCNTVPSVLGGFIGAPREKSAGAKRRALIKKLGR